MSDVYGDNEQLEALHRWWLENWKSLVAGLAVGIAVVVGWQVWTHHRATHRATAARMYADFSGALVGNKNKDVHAIAKTLTADYANTPYASMAELKLAQANVSNGQFKDAAKRLEWVAEHGNDTATRNIATLRLAAVKWQIGEGDAALKLLAHPSPAFAGLYAALRGDIQLSGKHIKAARKAYTQALAALPQDSTARPMVQHKLDDLGGLPEVAKAPASPASPASRSQSPATTAATAASTAAATPAPTPSGADQ